MVSDLTAALFEAHRDSNTSFDKRTRDLVVKSIKGLESVVSLQSRDIIALKRLLNLKSPIGRLPSELLLTIFLIVAEPEHPGDSFDCITITWVCSRWRNIALDCSSIWALLPLTSFSADFALKCVLPRSKQTPISFYNCRKPLSAKWKDVIDEVFWEHSSRLETLCLDVDDTLAASLQDVFCQYTGPYETFPSLKRLGIFGCPTEEGSDILLPLDFLKGPECAVVAPSLVDLTLSDIAVTWDDIPFSSGMKSLVLECREARSRPSLAEFLDVLETMPHLHNMTLENFLPEEEPPNHGQPNFIGISCTLSRLMALRLVDSAARIAQFFSVIGVPCARRVTAICTDSPLPTFKLLQMLRCLRESWPPRSIEVSEIAVDGSKMAYDTLSDGLMGGEFDCTFQLPKPSSTRSSRDSSVVLSPRQLKVGFTGSVSIPVVFDEFLKTMQFHADCSSFV